MVSFALTALAAAGIASASPVANTGLDHQLGFQLVVNVTDPHTDFKKHPVHDLRVAGLRAAPGAEMVTVDKAGFTFYGTKDKTVQWATDADTPYGLTSDGSTTNAVHSLGIDMNEATKHFFVSSPEDAPVCADLAGPGNGGIFLVCDNGFSAPHLAQYEVKYIQAMPGPPTELPKGCIYVNLIPECAPVDLSKVKYDHKNAVKTLCHKGKVANINWAKQPEC